jgi:hypothetical protein
MRPLSTSPAILIGGILALLLIAYVFIGGSRGDAGNAPHCTSPQALDLVKRELFRRAAATRGSNDPAFVSAQNYSVLHAQSRLVRRLEGGSGRVSCSGALVLDLPPGVAAAGGRRSLAAQLQYGLEPAGAGTARLLTLSNADDLVVPLATVSSAGTQAALGEALPVANEVQQETTVGAPPAPRPLPQMIQRAPAPPPPPQRAAPPPPPPQPRTSATAQAKSPQKPQPRKEASAAAHPKAAAPAQATPAPSPPAPAVAVVRPSFNCRYARTRGEVAVCGNPGLALLDRQMSGQFYGALAAARPGQRAMLQRSRDRFLAYRDSCGSDACVADAYRARMREISAIMEGRW